MLSKSNLKQLASLLETIVLGISHNLTISLKNRLVTLKASSVSWHGIKCVILQNLSTTTKIESFPCLDLGNHSTKSIETAV